MPESFVVGVMSIQQTEEAPMHPELRRALAQQRIDETYRQAARLRRRQYRSPANRLAAWLDRRSAGHDRRFTGKLESEAR